MIKAMATFGFGRKFHDPKYCKVVVVVFFLNLIFLKKI